MTASAARDEKFIPFHELVTIPLAELAKRFIAEGEATTTTAADVKSVPAANSAEKQALSIQMVERLWNNPLAEYDLEFIQFANELRIKPFLSPREHIVLGIKNSLSLLWDEFGDFLVKDTVCFEHTVLRHFLKAETDPLSLFLIGSCYYNEHVAVKNPEQKATELFEKAAALGNATALTMIGKSEAIALKEPRALYVIAENNRTHETVWDLYHESAFYGYEPAIMRLSEVFYTQVNPNPAKALLYFERTIAAGLARRALRQVNLQEDSKKIVDRIYRISNPIPSYFKTMGPYNLLPYYSLLQTEAKNDNPIARQILVNLIPQSNSSITIKLTKPNQRLNHIPLRNLIAQFYITEEKSETPTKGVSRREFVSGQLFMRCHQPSFSKEEKEDLTKEFEKLQKKTTPLTAAELIILGYIYHKLLNQPQQAFDAFKAAVDLRSILGMTMVGYCYSTGTGVEKNNEIAFGLFYTAASRGNAIAMHNMGVFYLTGQGCEQDSILATEYFAHSAILALYAFALNNLGHCFFNGYGVIQEMCLAKFLIGLSAELGDVNASSNLIYIDRQAAESKDSSPMSSPLPNLPFDATFETIASILSPRLHGSDHQLELAYCRQVMKFKDNPDNIRVVWALALNLLWNNSNTSTAFELFQDIAKYRFFHHIDAFVFKQLEDCYSQGRGTPIDTLRAQQYQMTTSHLHEMVDVLTRVQSLDIKLDDLLEAKPVDRNRLFSANAAAVTATATPVPPPSAAMVATISAQPSKS